MQCSTTFKNNYLIVGMASRIQKVVLLSWEDAQVWNRCRRTMKGVADWLRFTWTILVSALFICKLPSNTELSMCCCHRSRCSKGRPVDLYGWWDQVWWSQEGVGEYGQEHYPLWTCRHWTGSSCGHIAVCFTKRLTEQGLSLSLTCHTVDSSHYCLW